MSTYLFGTKAAITRRSTAPGGGEQIHHCITFLAPKRYGVHVKRTTGIDRESSAQGPSTVSGTYTIFPVPAVIEDFCGRRGVGNSNLHSVRRTDKTAVQLTAWLLPQITDCG